MKLNELEIALSQGEEFVNEYLGDVSAKDFIQQMKEIKKKYANKGAIMEAIKQLQALL